MALHPEFPAVPWVYLYNTESTTGADSNVATQVPLLGNRVDRFVWNGSTLSFDLNIIKLRAFQNDHNNVANPSLEVFLATTTVACCGSAPMASCTSSSVTMGDVVGIRTTSKGRYPTMTLVDLNLMMPI